MSAEQNVEQLCPLWEKGLKSAFLFSWIYRPSSPDLTSGMCSKSSKPGRSKRPKTLMSKNLLDEVDRNASILAIELHPLESSI